MFGRNKRQVTDEVNEVNHTAILLAALRQVLEAEQRVDHMSNSELLTVLSEKLEDMA